MANALRALACTLLVFTAACPANVESDVYVQVPVDLYFQGDGTGSVVVAGEYTHTCRADCNRTERDIAAIRTGRSGR